MRGTQTPLSTLIWRPMQGATVAPCTRSTMCSTIWGMSMPNRDNIFKSGDDPISHVHAHEAGIIAKAAVG